MRLLTALILLLGMTATLLAAEKDAPAFTRVDGAPYQLPDASQCKAIVLFFVGHSCPISNGYAPEIGRICKEYEVRGVRCVVVYAEADLAIDAARQHGREFGFPCPAILDPGQRLARQYAAQVMPEAAVLAPDRRLLYLGRIDDRYADFGKLRPQPTRTEVRDALDAILAGQAPKVSRAAAIGCDIHFPKQR